MSNIQIFSKDNFKVRTINEDGKIYFVAKDVAETLEYSDASNPARLFANVPEIWKGVKRIHTPGGEQDMLCLTEQGVYFFLNRSDKPKALPYQMWIAGDVVPSIRETGSYSIHKEQKALPFGVLDGAQKILELAGIKDNQLVLALDKMYQSYTGRSVLLTAGIELAAPEKKQLLNPTQIGRELGLSSRQVNDILAGMGYQHKINKQWEPIGDGVNYSVMLDVNKGHYKGVPVRQLKWTTEIIQIIKERQQS